MKKLVRKSTLALVLGVSLMSQVQGITTVMYGQDMPIEKKVDIAEKGQGHYPFTLMPLPYKSDSLEPYIDQKTIELHHGKHMQTYVDNLNKALEAYPKFQGWTLQELLAGINKIPKEIREAVKNNAGGVYNHQFYFLGLGQGTTLKDGKLLTAINEAFGSVDKMKEELKTAGLDQFGSGWSWLVSDAKGKLSIERTANQDTLVKDGLFPIIAVDVWEHAYYLDYYNRRDNYIDSFFNVVNWDMAEGNYGRVLGGS